MTRPTVIVLIAITAAAFLSLIMGASYLDVILPGGLPFGNALTAIGLCSAAGAAIGLGCPGTLHRVGAWASFGLAVLWLPVSILLAGNLALNFDGPGFHVWIWLSAVTVLAILGSLTWAFVLWSLKHLSNTGNH